MALNASNIAPGDLCILEEDDQPWPVVVWRDSMVPPAMLSGRLVGPNLPVLLLGRYDLRWALPSDLEGYLAPKEDELPDHDDYLLEAHREAAQFHELGYYEARWRDVCLARTLQKQHEANSQNSSAKKKASSVPRKRKVTRQSAAEPKDDRVKVPTSHEKFMSSLGSTKTEPDLYEDSEEDADTPGSEKKSKANPLQAIKPRIRVGSNPIIITRVPLKRIQQYQILDNIKQCEGDGQWYISREPFFGFEIKYFDPVAEFLRGSEYRPRLVDDGTQQAALEDFMPADAVALEKEVFRCGSTFLYAGLIKMHDLQRLAVRKLQVINQYPPFQILEVAQMVYAHAPGDSDPEATAAIRDLLECHIAKNFWKIAETDRAPLNRIMEDHADLAESVFAKRVEMAKEQRKAPVDVE